MWDEIYALIPHFQAIKVNKAHSIKAITELSYEWFPFLCFTLICAFY